MANSSSIPYYDIEAEIKHRVGRHIKQGLDRFDTNKKEMLGWSHSNNKKSSSPTWKILGCSGREFIKYIESKFSKGMSWDNRDQWDLDHIKPISSAKCSKDILLLCHYTNYQPLWRNDNIRKGNRS